MTKNEFKKGDKLKSFPLKLISKFVLYISRSSIVVLLLWEDFPKCFKLVCLQTLRATTVTAVTCIQRLLQLCSVREDCRYSVIRSALCRIPPGFVWGTDIGYQNVELKDVAWNPDSFNWVILFTFAMFLRLSVRWGSLKCEKNLSSSFVLLMSFRNSRNA